jgi:uncharacterized protein
MLIALGYIASILMGLSLGMIGGGGSILTVPILVYLFKIDPVVATGYSLFIVGLTAAVGSLTYFKEKMVEIKIGMIFAIPSFIGVYLARKFVVPNLPDPVFDIAGFPLSKPLFIMVIFAVLMVAASFSMIKSAKPAAKANKAEMSEGLRYLIIAAEGLVVGGVTGLVGAGGGFLIIPALVILVGLPMKKAVGTSLMIIGVKSLFGFLGDLEKSQNVIDWTLLLTVAAIAVAGIFVGAKLSKKVDEAKLKKAFGWFVLIMGSSILIEQVSSIFK